MTVPLITTIIASSVTTQQAASLVRQVGVTVAPSRPEPGPTLWPVIVLVVALLLVAVVVSAL